MNNVIRFPNSDVKECRQKCCFMNRAVQVEGEDGGNVMKVMSGELPYTVELLQAQDALNVIS